MIAAWMLYSILVAFLAALAGWCLDRMLRPYRLPIRWVWTASMLVGALGPLIPLVSGWLPLAASASSSPGAVPSAVPELATLTVGADSVLHALDPLLVSLWGVASMLLIAFAVLALVRLRRIVARSVPKAGFGVPVLVSDEIGPAALGAFRGRIVIPSWLAGDRSATRELTLRHEREHLEARDPLLGGAAFVLVALLPWNLALWWSLARLREAIEVDCDRRVLRDRPRILRDYAETLLEVSARYRPGLAPAPLFEARSFLERRIRAMTEKRPRRPLLRAAALGTVAALALAAACMSPSPDETETLSDPTSPAATDATGATGATGEDSANDAVSRSQGPEEEARASGRESGQDPTQETVLEEQPTFTPYTVAPDLRNRLEVQQALEDSYPPRLRDVGIGGTIRVWFFVDERGSVGDVRMNESSGNEALDEAALRVARTMEFTPALNEGDPVPVWIALPITFSTRD